MDDARDPKLSPLASVIAFSGLDAVALVPGANFRRLFQVDFHLMERPLIVIVPAKGAPAAIVPDLEMAKFLDLAFPGTVHPWKDETGYDSAFKAAGDALPHLKSASKFGLEAQRMRVFEQMALQSAFPSAQFTNAHSDISSIRLRKTDQEVDQIKQAIAISEAALEATLQQVRIGQTEKHIEGILLNELFAHGAHGLAFNPIVAAGDNSANPHASARPDYQIQSGDALLFDFGASVNGYNADITRTFFVGEVSDYDRAFYETVLRANERGKDVTEPGKSAHHVDDMVQQVLEKSQFAEFRVHKTGHGLGLDVHEAPQIMRGNNQELETGMVFTVEPGLYRPGECGVRIEDDVVVTENGVECLTNFSRELRIIG